MDPLVTITTRRTPQSERAESAQVLNNAGGWTFRIDDTGRLRRFLLLGTEGGTYYTGERALTADNARTVLRLAREDTAATAGEVVTVSTAGRAPTQNPALFTLAACAKLGDPEGRHATLDALPAVARTGTSLFLFARYLEQFGGWGRGTRRAVARWYTEPDVSRVAYQAVKYRQREGWSHRDLLRLSHPASTEPARRALFDWVTKGRVTPELPALVQGFLHAQDATSVDEWVRLIAALDLSWEMLPDAALAEPRVWTALLEHDRVPATALMRQLPRLTRLGLLSPLGEWTRVVTERLVDTERLRRGRIHPVSVLLALRTYAQGRSERGTSTWTPSAPVIDALDAAFYRAFATVEPTGKRTLLALDVSGSMTAPAGGTPLSCREVSAALALVTAATEPRTETVGFTSSGRWLHRRTAISSLRISPGQRLDDAIRAVSDLPFGGTDCSLPMRWALESGREVDTFVVYTDSETWAGEEHPHQALARYRRETGIPARLAVVALTPTPFSIADPDDAGMLDVVGFDTAMPHLVADFSRGAV